MKTTSAFIPAVLLTPFSLTATLFTTISLSTIARAEPFGNGEISASRATGDITNVSITGRAARILFKTLTASKETSAQNWMSRVGKDIECDAQTGGVSCFFTLSNTGELSPGQIMTYVPFMSATPANDSGKSDLFVSKLSHADISKVSFSGDVARLLYSTMSKVAGKRVDGIMTTITKMSSGISCAKTALFTTSAPLYNYNCQFSVNAEGTASPEF